MKLLLDTHLLLWAAGDPNRLSNTARELIKDLNNQPCFSAASIWEIAIKNGLGREDFKADPRLIRRALMDNGYEEIAITSEHTLGVQTLPMIHKDPFDRILVAQSMAEGILLLTADPVLHRYEGLIQLV